MAKLILNFDIPYDLKKKSFRSGRLHTETLGTLQLIGSFEQRESRITGVNIDFVRLKGHDIRPVLEAWDLLDELEDFCLGQASKFEPKTKEVLS